MLTNSKLVPTITIKFIRPIFDLQEVHFAGTPARLPSSLIYSTLIDDERIKPP
jgi:hypothetical protein